MDTAPAGHARPPIHLLAAESDMIASLAMQAEHRQPAVAAMLLDEIERAELHGPRSLPPDAVTIGSEIDFVDERNHQLRTARLVLPGEANIALGNISILTPVGAALYGVTAGQSIDWPDRFGRERKIRILRVRQPVKDNPAANPR